MNIDSLTLTNIKNCKLFRVSDLQILNLIKKNTDIMIKNLIIDNIQYNEDNWFAKQYMTIY